MNDDEKLTLSKIAKNILAANPQAGKLEIRTAQLDHLRATKKPGHPDIIAWERMVEYYRNGGK